MDLTLRAVTYMIWLKIAMIVVSIGISVWTGNSEFFAVSASFGISLVILLLIQAGLRRRLV